MTQERLGPLEVSIQFSCLETNEISADLYILLFCKYHDNCILPNIIKECTLEEPGLLDHLEEKGFIKITGEKEFVLRQKGIELFETSTPDTHWLEFLGTFPAKVPSQNGGTRPLKISNPESKGNDRIRKKYIALIKDKPSLHATIMKVLEAEMQMRKDSSSFQFMQNIETWINQANYDKFAYLLDEDKLKDESTPSGYGNKMT